MDKKYVEVRYDKSGNGRYIPRSILWEDGRLWKIDRVLHACRSIDGEYKGTRYTVIIGTSEKYLYRDGDTWYVEPSPGR